MQVLQGRERGVYAVYVEALTLEKKGKKGG